MTRPLLALAACILAAAALTAAISLTVDLCAGDWSDIDPEATL